MNNLIKALGTLLAITSAAMTVAAQAQVTEQWVARYDGPAHNYDHPSTMAIDAVGNIYVTGGSYGGNWTDYATVKYDANGNELWVRRYNGSAVNPIDSAVDLAVDTAGNVYVTGNSFRLAAFSSNVITTVKYDANGNELWVRHYTQGSLSNSSTALEVDASGNVYVVGTTSSISVTGASDVLTVKYDTNGNELWVRVSGLGANSSSSNSARGLVVDTVGNVFVTATIEYGAFSGAYATVKYDIHGNELWVRRYQGTGTVNNASGIAVDTTGNIYVTGTSGLPRWPSSGFFIKDYTTVKYDTNGRELWVRTYTVLQDDIYGDFSPRSAVDPTGNVYVAGSSQGSATSTDFATVKYDTNGNELWARRYNATSSTYNYVTTLAVDATGNAYVGGYACVTDLCLLRGRAQDYVILKYDTNGNEVWARRYNVPSLYPGPTALVVDLTGNVYATGSSYTNLTDSDYVTIKYSPDSQPAPTAVATASSTLLECVDINGETVTLSGAGSSDPGGLPLTYNWTGPFGTASGVTVNVPVPLGTHVITLTVSNGSSSATATVTVTVQDTIAPYVNAGANITLEASSSAGAAYTVTPVSSDACSTTGVVITPVLSIYPLGATLVTVTATDASRNSASDSLVVTVVDTTPPTLSVPANITTSATGALTPVTLGTATATDAVDGVITVTNNAPASGFAVGTTTVIYTVTDSHANSVSKSQLVTVTDTTGPTLTIPADITTEATGALTPVVLGTASASDAVDGALAVSNNAPAGGFPVGMTLVLYTATDSHANSVSMSQRVTVTDTTAPTLSVPADITVTATGMLTPVNLGTASAMDLVDGVVVVTNDAPLAGFPVGMATVTYTTMDSRGNSMTKTQRVTVTDSAAPLTVGNYTLISSTRVSRTDFIYTYRAVIFNSGFTTHTPTATLNIATPGVTILDGTLSFGTVPAGTTATSTDTFSLRHDRSSAFSEADFHWQIQ